MLGAAVSPLVCGTRLAREFRKSSGQVCTRGETSTYVGASIGKPPARSPRPNVTKQQHRCTGSVRRVAGTRRSWGSPAVAGTGRSWGSPAVAVTRRSWGSPAVAVTRRSWGSPAGTRRSRGSPAVAGTRRSRGSPAGTRRSWGSPAVAGTRRSWGTPAHHPPGPAASHSGSLRSARLVMLCQLSTISGVVRQLFATCHVDQTSKTKRWRRLNKCIKRSGNVRQSSGKGLKVQEVVGTLGLCDRMVRVHLAVPTWRPHLAGWSTPHSHMEK
eukprot:1195888-Prorocentrum_minimum.AAC.3